MLSDELLTLRTACAGLCYPSESDMPFEVFIWDDGELSEESVAERLGKSGMNIEIVSLNSFFDELSETPDSLRFKSLHLILEGTLRDILVYRIGSVSIDIVIVGRLLTGVIAGIQTKSIET